MTYTDALGALQVVGYNKLKTGAESTWLTGDNKQDYPFDADLAPANAKELEFIVNGKDTTNRKTITITAWRCVDNTCLDDVDEVEVETTTRLWSNAAAWTVTG